MKDAWVEFADRIDPKNGKKLSAPSLILLVKHIIWL